MAEIRQITSILPDDVLEEILLRLPVTHLLPLKCVCKDWYALIGDSRFHKKHYHFQYEMHLSEHNDIPLFLDSPCATPDTDKGDFYLLSKRQGVDVVLNLTPDFNRDVPPAFANDLDLRKSSRSCFGIVNGVVFLEWGRYHKRLALWNPATREFKDVARWPVLPDNEPSKSIDPHNAGFGFDLQTNDFKILGVLFNNTSNSHNEIVEFHLYSLKADSWKRIKEPPTSLLDLSHYFADTYLNNGVTYWLVVDSSDHLFSYHHSCILSFNLSTEIFEESKLPEGYGCNQGHVFCNCKDERMIGKYKEGPGLYVIRDLENADLSIEIWVVSKFSDDGNGVPLSWQRVCTIGPIHSFNGLGFYAIRVSGDILLFIWCGDKAEQGCIYDPSTCTYNFLGVIFSSCSSYVESLYRLSGSIN